jgi:cell fate regulator YaaT (PSP1 superfamily)
MNKIVGIRFRPAGKIYNFDSGAFVLNQGDHVILETENGLGFGFVAKVPVPADELKDHEASDIPLKKVYRLANENDFIQVKENIGIEKHAHLFCQKSINKLELKMNLFGVESSFDGTRLTFFFTSGGRVDFRELVRILVKELNIRVEMRQVGIRNQAKMSGGISRCGRQLCCSTFIEKFGTVSIRMAKDQGLSLNPTKISGLCGRLMCCLRFENETYKELKKNFPKIGKRLNIRGKQATVIRHNILGKRILLKSEDGDEIEVNLDELVEKLNH